tara:strand:+ start:386 stop:1057 length:672 start_codon:yes stop_codon:yes gene_type:complete
MRVNKYKIKTFIQARMSSGRLKGKVLKKIYGNTILEHVYSSAEQVFKKKDIIILTSTEKSDDKINQFCINKNINVFRGDLQNVATRYYNALQNFNCDYFFRVSADSPLIDSKLFKLFINNLKKNTNLDLVSNVVKRTFPKGQSLELINSQTFKKNINKFKAYDENFTIPFYKSTKFRIKSIENKKDLSGRNLCVDNFRDLERIRYIFNKYKNIKSFNFNLHFK